jgi:hypothetical protein
MKCFIACAFGKPDVDKMYKSIKKVLKTLKITPLRVDQLDFNNKIDQKIIALIDSCDFGIADLTYARPSVYYEAGRIHGLGKQVVFTARKDHFKPDPNDEHGNFRLHFDLITENVIGWSNDFSAFETSLRRRVNKVVKPLVLNHKQTKKLDEEQRTFQRQPYTERREVARVETIRLIKKNKFEMFENRSWKVVGVKNKKSATVVIPEFEISTTRKEIMLMYNRSYNVITDVRKAGYQITEVIVLLVCVTRVTDAMVHRALTWFTKVESTVKEYHDRKKEGLFRFVVIDDLKSPKDLQNRLETLLDRKWPPDE